MGKFGNTRTAMKNASQEQDYSHPVRHNEFDEFRNELKLQIDKLQEGQKMQELEPSPKINPNTSSGMRSQLQQDARHNIDALENRILEITSATEFAIDGLQTAAMKEQEENGSRIDQANSLFDQSLKQLEAAQDLHKRASEKHEAITETFNRKTTEIAKNLEDEIKRAQDGRDAEVSMLREMIDAQESTLATLARVVKHPVLGKGKK